jgi:PAS domain S-box-containing protein
MTYSKKIVSIKIDLWINDLPADIKSWLTTMSVNELQQLQSLQLMSQGISLIDDRQDQLSDQASKAFLASVPEEMPLKRFKRIKLMVPLMKSALTKMIMGKMAWEPNSVKSLRDLIESDEIYKKMIQKTQTIVGLISTGGVVQFMNPGVTTVLGYRVDEVVGKNFFDFVDSENADLLATQLTKQIKNDDWSEYFLSITNKQGKRVPVMINPKKIEVDGKIIGTYGFIRDVSALVEKHEELEKANHAIREAMDSGALKDAVIQNMRHEFRTPLNVIIGAADALSNASLDIDQRALLNDLRLSAYSLLRMLNNLMALSEYQKESLVLSSESFDMKQLAEKQFRLIKERITPKIDFKLDLKDLDVSNLKGDVERIQMIVMNLLDNAFKFTESGTITFRISSSCIGENHEMAIVNIEVSDTGKGIPLEIKDQVLQPFLQQDMSSTRKYGGLGLGLPTVSTLTKAMTGTLNLISEEGAGTQVKLSIPMLVDMKSIKPALDVIDKVAKSHSLDRVVSKGNELEGLKILMVEDGAVIRKLLDLTLVKRGSQEVVQAENGKEGVEAFEKGDFDVVLMDLQMPVMDGFESSKKMVKLMNIRDKQVPIIAVTAHGEQGEIHKALESGMVSLLTKPADADILVSEIIKHVPGLTEIDESSLTPVTSQGEIVVIDFKKLIASIGKVPSTEIKDLLLMIIRDSRAYVESSLEILDQEPEDLYEKLRALSHSMEGGCKSSYAHDIVQKSAYFHDLLNKKADIIQLRKAFTPVIDAQQLLENEINRYITERKL